MSAKFLGRGFKPLPKNNPPKGGGLNPLCFGYCILKYALLLSQKLVFIIGQLNTGLGTIVSSQMPSTSTALLLKNSASVIMLSILIAS
ncbi:hypothetical protein QUA35_04555 [Microcoleus sp. N9_B2]|uniref:hypothetical protein n=1 Tax=unclassified Microcoleus TaxID=2642155 RepID=UPI002FD0DF16